MNDILGLSIRIVRELRERGFMNKAGSARPAQNVVESMIAEEFKDAAQAAPPVGMDDWRDDLLRVARDELRSLRAAMEFHCDDETMIAIDQRAAAISQDSANPPAPSTGEREGEARTADGVGTGATHPEDYCERCGGKNIKPWFAPSEIWNKVAGEHSILCPQCFVELAESSGLSPTAWVIAPEGYLGCAGQRVEDGKTSSQDVCLVESQQRMRGGVEPDTSTAPNALSTQPIQPESCARPSQAGVESGADAKDAARYREIRNGRILRVFIDREAADYHGETIDGEMLDEAADAAIGTP